MAGHAGPPFLYPKVRMVAVVYLIPFRCLALDDQQGEAKRMAPWNAVEE